MKEERFIRTVCDTSDLSNCFGNRNLRLLDFLLLLSQSFFVPVHVRAAAVTAQPQDNNEPKFRTFTESSFGATRNIPSK